MKKEEVNTIFHVKTLDKVLQVTNYVSVLVSFSTICLPLLSVSFGEIKNSGPDSVLQLDFFLYMPLLI